MLFEQLKSYLPDFPTEEIKRGQIVYNQGDNPERLFFVVNGLIGLFHISENGKETLLRIFNQNSLFGHRSYFADTPYHATAIALTKTVVGSISKAYLDKIIDEHPLFQKNITKNLAQDLGDAELRLAGLVDKTVTKRVIETLIYLKLRYNEKTWTRKEIAEFSGSTFETVARVMSKLDDLSLINKSGRDFEIPNPDKLIEYSEMEV